MTRIKFIISLVFIGLLTNQIVYSAACETPYEPTDEMLKRLSIAEKHFLRIHERSPAIGLINRYKLIFDGGGIDEIDISELSRRARVIFIAGCLNTNIDFLYDTLNPDKTAGLPRAVDVFEDKQEIIETKFDRVGAFYISKFPVKIRFGHIRATITPRPTRNQHGNFLLELEEPVDTSSIYKDLVGGALEYKKPAALTLLKRHDLFPLTAETVGKALEIEEGEGRITARNTLNILALLFEGEISRRYVAHAGVHDLVLASLPYVFAIAEATDLDQLIKCFRGNVDTRKSVIKEIVEAHTKARIIEALGGKGESQEVFL